MKAITALNLLKKNKLIGNSYTLREIKMVRELLVGKQKSWEDFIRHVMSVVYLSPGRVDLSEPICIPEVNWSIGGTLKLNVSTGESGYDSRYRTLNKLSTKQ